MTNAVEILGAGFSKGVASLPVVAEIAGVIETAMIADRKLSALAALVPPRDAGERFEQWLSRLA